jgi:type IV pilus assembly protein PilB
METSNTSLGQILKKRGVITEEQLNKALTMQKELSIRLGEVITRMGVTTPEEIISGLAELFGSKVVNPLELTIPDNVINTVPKEIASKYNIIPVKKQNESLTVAISDPLDISTLEDLYFRLNLKIEYVLATPHNIEQAIKRYYHKREQENDIHFEGLFEGIRKVTDEVDTLYEYPEALAEEAEAPIVKFVTHIINEALKVRASDIHIEPLSNKTRVRFRIDGVCQEMHSITKNVQDALISRIKILSQIDITEKRKPQDGRIDLKGDGKSIDIRVSTIPTTCGESIVMRLLEKSSALIKLKSIGLSQHDLNNFKNILKRPNGIILVTGPTGSGKSTTLYAALNEFNSLEKKIITVEDPIEYNIPGVNQCEVNEKIGLTFPNILRSILRQDPNIIVIGEIRDVDTAEIAVSASLTGHLVLSTLHTNDAASAITRLTNMGVSPFLISSSIQAIVAQRLVRIICPECKTPHRNGEKVPTVPGLNINDLENAEFYHGTGCEHCNKTGYYGRAGIFEFMCIGSELKEAIHRKAPTHELGDLARSNGMKTLMEDGLRLANNQVTTLEEVMRVSMK